MKIFLAYASQDRADAESIAFSLRGRGHQVFLDRDDLPAGTSYDQQIERAVNGSHIFIFLISPDSLTEGRYTLTELAFARRKWPSPSGRVLPVMTRKMPSEVPAYLKAVTILKSDGNIAADTSAAVDKMRAAQLSILYRNALFLAGFCGIAGILVFMFFRGPKEEGQEGLAQNNVPAVQGQLSGGTGGLPFNSLCLPGEALIGVSGTSGTDKNYLVFSVAPVCARIYLDRSSSNISVGNSRNGESVGSNMGSSPFKLLCPEQTVVVGSELRAALFGPLNYVVRPLQLKCSKFLTARDELAIVPVSAPGDILSYATFRSFTCPSGYVGSGIHGRAGQWIDALGIECRKN